MFKIDGRPVSFWLYPPPRYGGKPRSRTYGYMEMARDKSLVVVDETGEVHRLENDGADIKRLYVELRNLIGHERRSVFVRQMKNGYTFHRLIAEAVHDEKASVVYSPTTGPRGIRWRVGNNRGSLLSQSAWYRNEGDNADWIRGLRRAADTVGVGDYDTAGSLGEATLSRFFDATGLGRSFRLGNQLGDTMRRYSIGGRAEVRGIRGMVYPAAIELDLSSAYPTAVARGLPMGMYGYTTMERRPMQGDGPLFGVWRITVHEDIPVSPVPWKDWDHPKLWSYDWNLDGNQVFEYGGWDAEIEALRATGRATCELLYGWRWGSLSSCLAPWVDELVGYRRQMERAGDEATAAILKNTVNAAIGRWGMSNERWDLISHTERDISRDDLPIDFTINRDDDGGQNDMLDVWVRKVNEESQKATPYHWNSYARMCVRIELWRKMMDLMSQGYHIIDTNFDCIRYSEPPQATNSMEVIADQSLHPLVWKRKPVSKVEIPYVRGAMLEEGGIERAFLPGLSGAMRQSIIVDHRRRKYEESRQDAQEPVPTGAVG